MSVDRLIKLAVLHDDPVAQAGLMAAFAGLSDVEVQNNNDLSAGGAFMTTPGRYLVDVVVCDHACGVAMAGEALRRFARNASPKVVIVSGVEREWEIRTAIESGVRGYLLPGCSFDELARAVRAAHRGLRYLSPRVAERLAESMCGEALTGRETETLRLVVDGFGNKAIADRLGIAEGTVKSHLKAVFDKLGVRSRTQAVAAVERRGLLPKKSFLRAAVAATALEPLPTPVIARYSQPSETRASALQ